MWSSISPEPSSPNISAPGKISGKLVVADNVCDIPLATLVDDATLIIVKSVEVSVWEWLHTVGYENIQKIITI